MLSKKKQNLCLVLALHQCYIRHIEGAENFGAENDILFSSISNVYLPLLNTIQKLEESNIDGKISLVVSPVLCELLTDPLICEQYVNWLEKRISLGEKELTRLSDDEKKRDIAQKILEKARNDLKDFTERYGSNIIKEIAHFASKGRVELLATCATWAYLPHYADMEEVVSAQIEAGLHAHKRFFGSLPDGFLLPYLGYTNGIERILRSFGVNYTIIDSRGLFFSPDVAEKGIFAPVRKDVQSPLAFFAADPESTKEIEKIQKNGVFRANASDIGFELSSDYLCDFVKEGSARFPTGYRYFSNDGNVYDSKIAQDFAEKQAEDFVKSTLRRFGRHWRSDACLHI